MDKGFEVRWCTTGQFGVIRTYREAFDESEEDEARAFFAEKAESYGEDAVLIKIDVIARGQAT